jgi:hypothetical protein
VIADHWEFTVEKVQRALGLNLYLEDQIITKPPSRAASRVFRKNLKLPLGRSARESCCAT